MFSSKAKNYSIPRLIWIAFFKILQRFTILLEKVKIRIIDSQWTSLNPLLIPDLNVDIYLRHCDQNKSRIVNAADEVVSGKITIFHQIITFDVNKDWLKDPISGTQWDKSVISFDAETKKNGFGDAKYILEINKFNFLVQVAHAYYLTKNEKYIQFIEKACIGWMKSVKPERSLVNKIIMDYGFRIINITQIVFLCYDNVNFQKHVLPFLLGVIDQHEKIIRRFASPRWMRTGNGGNHDVGEMVGILCAQWMLEAFTGVRYQRYQKKEYIYLMDALDRTVALSGVYLENSSNYARLVSEFLICFDLLRGVFNVSTRLDSKYKKKGYAKRLIKYVSDIEYHNRLPNFGDNDDAQVLIPFKKGLDDISFITNMSSFETLGSYIKDGQWVYRSKDKSDLYIFTRVGSYSSFKEGANNHVHNDMLAILLGVKGQFVFIDKGCYYYNSGLDLMEQYKSVSAHNTIIIDGVDQSNIKGWAMYDYPLSKCIIDEKSGNSCNFEGVVEYNNIKHTRKIKYESNAIIIEDLIENDEESSISGYIQYILAPEIMPVSDKNQIVLHKKNSFIASLSIEGVNRYDVAETDFSPSYACKLQTKVIHGFFNNITNSHIIKTYIKL